MGFNVKKTVLDGVLVIEPAVFDDDRGFFLETWQRDKYAEAGVKADFIQDNHSRSQRGVIRGLHYQLKHSQAKLVYAVRGCIFDVAVDIRRGSPTFGQWTGCLLSDENHRQLFVPEGFAHGFSVLSDYADVTYKCSNFYAPGDEYGILYNDPDLNITWQVDSAIVSDKDLSYPFLRDISLSNIPEG